MDTNKSRVRATEIKYAELYHGRTVPQHWLLLGKILHANAERNIMLRDELMLQLATYTGKGDVVGS